MTSSVLQLKFVYMFFSFFLLIFKFLKYKLWIIILILDVLKHNKIWRVKHTKKCEIKFCFESKKPKV